MAVSRPRVLVLSQAPGLGGGERVVLSALASVDSLEVTVVGYPAVCRWAEELGLRAVALKLPRVHRLTQPGLLVRGSFKVARVSREIRADVIYANGTRAMPYGVGARVLTRRPLIAHHHGLLTAGPVRSLVAALVRTAGAIIAPSLASAAVFGSRKVEVVPTGIDLVRFQLPEDHDEAKRELGIPAERLVVGTVTRADPRKGMWSFLRLARWVAAAFPAAHFLLVGAATFPEERRHYEAVRREAKKLGERIALTGVLEDPVSAFHAMDVFVHLGEPEGLPTTVIEAMACKLPVVGYRWGGIVEIVEDGATGTLVDPGDEEAAAQAVGAFLVDAPFRMAAGQSGRARCEERYERKQFAASLTRIVLSVVER